MKLEFNKKNRIIKKEIEMKIKTQNIKQNLRSSTTYRLKDTQKRTFDVKFKKK